MEIHKLYFYVKNKKRDSDNILFFNTSPSHKVFRLWLNNKKGKKNMEQGVFNRYEKKYLLNEDTYQILQRQLEPYMVMDQYGVHNIRNIYFDTETDELIRTSIEKPVYKEKFRLRCYGEPKEDSEVFLEIKKKYKGVVNKRRITMPKWEAERYLLEGIKLEKDSQIFREIDYMIKHYNVSPKLYLSYDRIALFGKEDSELRITFDQNIRSRRQHLDIADDTNTEQMLEQGMYLMEVKIKDVLPMWFVDILSELQLRNVSFSKYGRIYQSQEIKKRKNMETWKNTDEIESIYAIA